MTTTNKTVGNIDSFSGYGLLSCVLIGQNATFMFCVLSGSFKKSNVSFNYSLTSVHSGEQCLVINSASVSLN